MRNAAFYLLVCGGSYRSNRDTKKHECVIEKVQKTSEPLQDAVEGICFYTLLFLMPVNGSGYSAVVI